MSSFAKKRKRNKRVPIMYQAGVQTLIRGVLKHPFDVSMATLIVLVDVDPTISQMRDVQEFMENLTEGEQEFAVMLEAALQANKLQKTRMQAAVDQYNAETGAKLRIGDAARDEDFAAWLPGYNVLMQDQWRADNPEAAAAYDAQQALLTQGVGVLQATDPQGDVRELVPEGVMPVGWDMGDGTTPYDINAPAKPGEKLFLDEICEPWPKGDNDADMPDPLAAVKDHIERNPDAHDPV